jgi:hypothetical protein
MTTGQLAQVMESTPNAQKLFEFLRREVAMGAESGGASSTTTAQPVKRS